MNMENVQYLNMFGYISLVDLKRELMDNQGFLNIPTSNVQFYYPKGASYESKVRAVFHKR